MHKKTIYFNQKSLHRERQADTAKYAADFFDVISPLKKTVDNLKTFNKPPFYMSIIIWIVSKIPMINVRKMPRISESADYIYTRWDIPFFPKKPFVVELDNPYVLTFYNYFAFKLFKPIIKLLLKSKKCKKIVCISEACKKTFLKEMGEWFKNKTMVLYPRMKDSIQTINKEDKKVRFLFIGLHPRLKWLYELLEAFYAIKDDNIILEIIWFNDTILEKKYASDSRILFLWQIPRNDILSVYLPKANVLIFPSFFESFGIVALEALSHGLGIITTNVFALPEVCKDWYNWKIIKNPYIRENEFGFVDITKMTMSDFTKKYLYDATLNSSMVNDIKYAIEDSIKNYKVRQDHSKQLYNDKFCQKVREKSFLEVFK